MSEALRTRSVDPWSGEPFGAPWIDTSVEQLETACAAAQRASKALRWSNVDDRAGWLSAVGAALEAKRADLVALADRETGLGEGRLNGELTRTIYQLEFLGDEVRSGRYLGATVSPSTDTPMGLLPDLRRTSVPLGPVAVFAASNFPFAFSVAGGDTASAIAAGCPVVVKVHPSHPALSAMVADLMTEAMLDAGAPTGVFATVSGMDAGARLVQHPATAAVAFTGSLQGGRALFDLAVSRPDPIPFYGELGSVNPVVVTSSAARERSESIGQGWVESLTLGGGQFCTKPGLLLIPAQHGEAILRAVSERIADVPAQVLLNDSIRGRFLSGVSQLKEFADALAESHCTVGSGFAERPLIFRTSVTNALAYPTVLEEVFGPAGLVVEYADLDEVEAVLRHVGGSLTVSIHGEAEDPDASPLVEMATLVGGRIIWNGYPTGVAVSPSMQHGGPWPASTSPRDTSVGSAAINRFVRPVSFQGVPTKLLPAEIASAP